MLRADDLHHGYGTGRARREVLRGVGLTIRRGERLGVAGPSGVGKSTLGRLLALVERPAQGRILLDDVPVVAAGTRMPAHVRRRVHLLWQSPRAAVDPRWRLARVIAEPLLVSGARMRAVTGQVVAVAESVGLTDDLLARHPNELSDGQLQRACLARALLLAPDVLVADELGSALDVSTQATLLRALEPHVVQGMAAVVISHDDALLRHWCDRVVELDDGLLQPRGSLDADVPVVPRVDAPVSVVPATAPAFTAVRALEG